MLAWSLHHRWIVVGSSLGIFVVAIWILTRLPLSFFPTTDSGQLTVGINLPPGTPLQKTDQVARDVERVVMAQPEVQRVFARVGQAKQSADRLGFRPVGERDSNRPCNPAFTGFAISIPWSPQFFQTQPVSGSGVRNDGGGASVRGRPVVILVQGPVSLDTLLGVANQIVQRLNTVPGLRDVSTSVPPQTPALNVVVDRQRAANAGVSTATLGQTISTLFQDTAVTQVDWQGYQRMNVTVQLRDEDLSDPSVLMNLPISASNGDFISSERRSSNSAGNRSYGTDDDITGRSRLRSVRTWKDVPRQM